MKLLPIFNGDLAPLIFSIIIAYLLGSIPFGLIWANIYKLGNLKDIGSGNIGATNVLRTGNKIAAFLTLICDAGKGLVAVSCAEMLTDEFTVQAVCVFVLIGTCFPIWLQFKGGKGVATYIGIAISINFTVGIITCMIWLLSAVILRMSSLSALISAIFGPFLVYFLLKTSFIGMSILLTCMIFFTHRQNIRRILNGTETRISVK